MSIKLVKLNDNILNDNIGTPIVPEPVDAIYYQVIKGSSETKSAENQDQEGV